MKETYLEVTQSDINSHYIHSKERFLDSAKTVRQIETRTSNAYIYTHSEPRVRVPPLNQAPQQQVQVPTQPTSTD